MQLAGPHGMSTEQGPTGGSEVKGEQRRMAEERSRPPVIVIHEAIRLEGQEELQRPSIALAWSGLAAGLSMGFSLLAQGLLRSYLPATEAWSPLVWRFGYALGFTIVVLGRQELFTETTLTAVVPLLDRRDRATLLDTMRVWCVVLGANVAGVLAFAGVLWATAPFTPSIQDAFTAIGHDAVAGNWGSVFVRAIFAGWLIALVVWLLPLSGGGRIWIIILITYVVGLGNLTHIVAGSVEAVYAAMSGAASWATYLGTYVPATLAGNIIGGASLVAALNTAQTRTGRRRR